jgi:hypothetical protein
MPRTLTEPFLLASMEEVAQTTIVRAHVSAILSQRGVREVVAVSVGMTAKMTVGMTAVTVGTSAEMTVEMVVDSAVGTGVEDFVAMAGISHLHQAQPSSKNLPRRT